MSIRSKKAFLSEGKNINLQNSKIQFNSINVNEDVFDVYILYKDQKIKNTNSNDINYYRILAKEIGVTDDFKEMNFTVVNNISLKIKIKIKNKYDVTQKISVKDRLKFFNSKVEDSKKSVEEFNQKYKKWDDAKASKEKGTNQKEKEPSNKKIEQPKPNKEPEKKNLEQNKKPAEQQQRKSIEQTKKVNKPNNTPNTKTNNNTNNAQNKPTQNKPKQTQNKTEPKQANQNNKTIDKSKTLLPPQVNNPKNSTAKAFQKTQGELPPKKEIPTSGEIFIEPTTYGTKTLELNNLAATICFPTGIKVCYNEVDGPNPIKDYVTSITNQKGERYYMMTYHFYLKYDIDDYQKKYEEHPLKYNLSKFADAYTSLSEEELTEDKINEIQELLLFSQELGNRDIIFVPFCICLISKYPYVKEMQKCLNSIYTILNQNEENSPIIINDLITYLIHAIPIPSKNTNVNFLIPYQKNCIELDCPKLEDINIMSASATELLKNFSIDNLVVIFRLLITEKKILLIDEDYERLSKVSDGLISILYPFQWIHTYIPIMSDQMLKYLETFLPFLNGINKSLMPFVEKVFRDGEIQEDDEVFLIYISEDKDKIRLSSSIRGIKKKVDKYISDNVPQLPTPLEKDLKNKLKKAKAELDSKSQNTTQDIQRLELKIRDAFIDLFVEMFHDYAQYLSFLEEDTVFNKPLFMEKQQKNYEKFYNEVLDTQLFQQFTQNVVNDEVGYFNTKIAQRENKEESKEKKNKEILKRYYINPKFLNLESDLNMKKLEQELNKKYPFDENDKNIVPILEKSIIIKDNKYNENQCKIYMTPEEKELSKEKKEENKTKKKVIVAKTNKISEKLKALKLDANEKFISKNNMSEKEQENMKELIKDYVVKIFKSEEIEWEAREKTELMNKLNTSFGRDFFISLLSKNTLNVILLKDNSFHLLFQLIYNCIINTLKLEETNEILNDLVLLIKSTKYFGITEFASNYTMFEKYKIKIQDVPKIRQDNFWEIWYETEISKKKDAKVEDKQQIIYDICQTLIQLELPKSMVKKLTDNINIKQFGKGTDLQKKTFEVFIKFIINAKYVSQAI